MNKNFVYVKPPKGYYEKMARDEKNESRERAAEEKLNRDARRYSESLEGKKGDNE